jgi:Lrp/AsnC family transcriptional regulator for asnA, asnC and gidA
MSGLPATAATVPIALDATDQAIIALLRTDGRLPYRAIARELGVTENTVRARVRRLEESGTMRVVAVTDIEAAGFSLLLAIGVQVEGRSPEAVARDLAGFPQVFSVNVVVGAQDIEILVVSEDQGTLNELVGERLAAVPGVRRLTPALALDVLKNQPDWVPFHDGPLPDEAFSSGNFAGNAVPGTVVSRRRLDEVDKRIVARLSRDARLSNGQIAGDLGVTEGTVRARIKRMEEEKLIRLTAVTNIDRFGDALLAYIWIEVERSNQTRAVAGALATIPELGFVGVMLGRSDILAITMVRNTEHLAEFVHTRISSVDGVRRTESTLGVNFVKHDYRMARIVS